METIPASIDKEQNVSWGNEAQVDGEQARAKPRGVLAGLGFAALTFGVAAAGAIATRRGKGRPQSLWYRLLRKPSYQPPNRVFGPVWTVLYGAIAYSGWRVWRSKESPERTAALGLWATQLALNAAWSPLFFGARRPRAALLDLIVLDASAAAYTAVASKVDTQAGATVLPYLGWLGFATALNSSIVAKNPSILLKR
ncbi:MAG TPA: TspO/MBR family protein [Kofleriaceae bacterium]|jgi:tryptophan-rich sensory protein